MYRVRSVAEALDVSVATIYRAIESGKLDALKHGTGKGTLRVPGQAVNDYINSCAGSANNPLPAGQASSADDKTTQEVA
ncbi:MAG: helix-turn-helix domain-containing protein [Pseudonocardiaceae bacterium]|nr:helix-turn-helix domain-containing protein [Pseudonocardiaceae bacterium]